MTKGNRPTSPYFANRITLVDERADVFLRTLTELGGYCTVEQARRMGVASSPRRTRARLRALQRSGFLRRVSGYPVVYQVTKSVNRLLDRDSRARRCHRLETVQARVLAVSFYLEAIRWPASFIFDHTEKVAALTEAGCPKDALPQRRQKPYLWEYFLIRSDESKLRIVIVDHAQRSAFCQLRGLMTRFSIVPEKLPGRLNFLIVTGSETRSRLYGRLTRHPHLQRLSPEPFPVHCYRVRGIPEIPSLISPPRGPESDFLPHVRELDQSFPNYPPNRPIIES